MGQKCGTRRLACFREGERVALANEDTVEKNADGTERGNRQLCVNAKGRKALDQIDVVERWADGS